MIELKLETKNKEQEKIKEYLQENASELLATKINNGVKIVKDNKSLVNKKDLNGFWNYATNEARKLTEKSQNGAYVDDETVYGWAIHYFEEDSIEGILYNEDGSEYQTVVKQTPKQTQKTEVKKEDKPQQTLFDFMDIEKPKETMSYKAQLAEKSQPDPLDIESEEDCEEDEDWCEEEKQEVLKEELKTPEYYRLYEERQKTYPDLIVLTRLGDFYEAYNQSADIIAKKLNLTLTSRDLGLENRVKMAGFPHHVKEDYFNKLTRNNTLLVIENDKEEFIEQQKTEIEKIEVDYDNPTFDKFLMETISVLLDGKVVIK